MKPLVAALAIAAGGVTILAVAWGDDGVPRVGALAADVSDETAQVRLGGCSESGRVEYAPIYRFLASAERWMEVRNLNRDAAAREPRERDATFSMEVEPIGPGAEGAGDARTESFTIHGSMLPAIEWALRSAGRPFLAMGPKSVRYVMVELKSGGHLFAGDCQYAGFTRPLYDGLKERTDAALASIVGETGKENILARLGQSEPPADDRPKPRFLSSGDVSDKELARLTRVTLAIDEGYAKLFVKKYSPIAAPKEERNVLSGLR